MRFIEIEKEKEIECDYAFYCERPAEYVLRANQMLRGFCKKHMLCTLEELYSEYDKNISAGLIEHDENDPQFKIMVEERKRTEDAINEIHTSIK